MAALGSHSLKDSQLNGVTAVSRVYIYVTVFSGMADGIAKAVHVMLETSRKFFRIRDSNIFFRENFVRAATCRPGSDSRRAPENFGLVLVQFPVWWCFWTITLPFIGIAAELPKVRLRDSQTPWS